MNVHKRCETYLIKTLRVYLDDLTYNFRKFKFSFKKLKKMD